MFDIWDIYQQIRIRDLDNRVDRIEGAPTTDALARDEVVRLEEKLDRLALIARAMFELSGIAEEKLTAKVLEIDLRDGQNDGRMSPAPKRCPKCDAMMSPKFGRCLFCGHRDELTGAFR
jgi:hypothetical protein